MHRETAAALGEAWTDDYPRQFLTRLTEIGSRLGGHPGERRAADLVAEGFERAGAREVTVESFEMNRWTRGDANLRVTAPADRSAGTDAHTSGAVGETPEPVERTFETVALPYSPAGAVEGELVDAGYGTPDELDERDVEGKVVVASTTTPEGSRFIHRMEKFGHAAEAGAAAFVFRNHEPGQLPPTGALRFDAEAAIPGVGVSKETGEWLVEYADRGGTASLAVDAATEPATSHNAHALLGPETETGTADADAGDEILVVGHHDAHDVAEGALDNGCGIAVVVAAAHLLAGMDLETRVRVAGVGCEEIGLLGAEALADRLDLDAVRAVVNVDGAGRFRDLRAFAHGSGAVTEVVEAVADAADHPIATREQVHPFSDHWPFLRRGVPALQLHSEPADQPAATGASGAGRRGRGWTHTRADTRDKVDDRNVREHAMLTALLVRELAATDRLPRQSAETVAENLRSGNYEEGMRAAGVWPDGWE